MSQRHLVQTHRVHHTRRTDRSRPNRHRHSCKSLPRSTSASCSCQAQSYMTKAVDAEADRLNIPAVTSDRKRENDCVRCLQDCVFLMITPSIPLAFHSMQDMSLFFLAPTLCNDHFCGHHCSRPSQRLLWLLLDVAHTARLTVRHERGPPDWKTTRERNREVVSRGELVVKSRKQAVEKEELGVKQL